MYLFLLQHFIILKAMPEKAGMMTLIANRPDNQPMPYTPLPLLPQQRNGGK
jgi:hypothetical protein